MAEGTTFDLRQYQHEMDEMDAGIMPSHWAGHGRMKIFEFGLDEEKRSVADKVFERMKEKYPEQDAEKLAAVVIEKVT